MRRTLVILMAAILAGVVTVPSLAQGTDPYADLDPIETSTTILRRGLGPGGPSALLEALDDRNVPEIETLLALQLEHPSPLMRTTAATRLIGRGRPPLDIVDSLRTTDERSALVVSMLASDALTPEVASRLLDKADLSEFVQVVLLLTARPDDLKPRLRAIEEDENLAPVARGLAAAGLSELGDMRIDSWLAGLDAPSDAARDRTIFDVIVALDALELTTALGEFDRLLRSRPADDALRAAVVIGLFKVAPKSGMEAWRQLAEATTPSGLVPVGFLLINAEQPCSQAFLDRLTSTDRMQVAIRSLLATPPEERNAAARPLVELGHPATLRWLGECDPGSLPTGTIESFLAITSERPTTPRIQAAIEMATVLADRDRKRYATLLQDARKSPLLTEILLRGATATSTKGAGEVARPFLDDPDRSLRAIALIAVALQGTPDDGDWKRLAKLAAGGGGLPPDLRPIAAWYHLSAKDALAAQLPIITAP